MATNEEIIAAERDTLIRDAEDALARRMQNATSIGTSDGALQNHKWAVKRIWALTDEQLLAKAAARQAAAKL